MLRAALADRYRIERELGHGGMATVYLAHDIRHSRRVALKVLRPELAAVIGAERFLAEIRTTANLQHPHILPLHDSGETDSYLFYVMPYVEGESLRARLLREKQLPVLEAVRIATEMASALDYAHRHGVIHRDIKPENILLHESQALVADFGIALAVSNAGSSRMTETGLSLGTPQYMSPEQALGERDITARSDVYALGVVLYEMLSGEPPFTGPTPNAVVAKLLSDQPASLRRHRHTIPERVELAVLTALEKLPADRFTSAAEFAEALVSDQTHRRRSGNVLRRDPVITTRRFAASKLLWFGALALAGFGAAAAWLRVGGARGDSDPPVRFAVYLPGTARLSGSNPAPVFSRDGQYLVLPGVQNSARNLFLVPMSTGEPRLIPGTTNACCAAFSPDGRWLAFQARGKLMKVSLDGGSPIVLADAEGVGVAWGRDGTIIYNRKYNTGLWRISESGGVPDTLTSPGTEKGELGHWWPQFLPGGHAVLFTAYGGSVEQARIEVVSLKTGQRKTVLEGGSFGRYVSGGRLFYFRSGNVMAVPFSPSRREVKGAPVPVLQHVAVDRLNAVPLFTTSETGAMAWVPDSLYLAPRVLVWLNRAGRESPALADPGVYSDPRLSPDGQRVALTVEEETPDIWVLNLTSRIRTRLTRGPGVERYPLWTPDGRRVIYQAENGAFDVFSRSADASDTATLLISTRFDKYPFSMSPDGRQLVLMEDSLPERILIIQPELGRKAVVFAPVDFAQQAPMMSPDGRWLAFASNESGKLQMVIVPYGRPGSRRQVTQAGLSQAAYYPWIRWSANSKELFYATGDSLMTVPFESRTGVTATPRLILRGPYEFGDIAPDGQRFLAIKYLDQAAPRRFNVVLNWPELGTK